MNQRTKRLGNRLYEAVKNTGLMSRRRRQEILNSIIDKAPESFTNGTAQKLSRLNQKEKDSNAAEALAIMSAVVGIGLIYFCVAIVFFHDLWYHQLLCGISSIEFSVVIWQNYFEIRERKLRKDIARTIEVFLAKYESCIGNVLLALKETEDRISKEMKPFIRMIRLALESTDIEGEIDKAKEKISFDWLKMFADLLCSAKIKGQVKDANGVDAFKDTLEELNMFFAEMNIMADEIGFEHKSIEAIMLLVPLATVIGAKIMYAVVFKDFPAISLVYDSLQAKNLVSLLFVTANLAALFTRWVRKHQM